MLGSTTAGLGNQHMLLRHACDKVWQAVTGCHDRDRRAWRCDRPRLRLPGSRHQRPALVSPHRCEEWGRCGQAGRLAFIEQHALNVKNLDAVSVSVRVADPQIGANRSGSL